jgi:hypothetical protein
LKFNELMANKFEKLENSVEVCVCMDHTTAGAAVQHGDYDPDAHIARIRDEIAVEQQARSAFSRA